MKLLRSLAQFALTMILWFILSICISIVIRWYTTANEGTDMLKQYQSKRWYWLSGTYYFTNNPANKPFVEHGKIMFQNKTQEVCIQYPTTEVTCDIKTDAIQSSISDLQSQLSSLQLRLKDNEVMCVDLNKIADDIITVANKIRDMKDTNKKVTFESECKSGTTQSFWIFSKEIVKGKTVYVNVLPFTWVPY